MLNFMVFILSSSSWKVSLTSLPEHSWHSVPLLHRIYLSCKIIFIVII